MNFNSRAGMILQLARQDKSINDAVDPPEINNTSNIDSDIFDDSAQFVSSTPIPKSTSRDITELQPAILPVQEIHTTYTHINIHIN